MLVAGSVSAIRCDGDCPPPCADVDICTWTTNIDDGGLVLPLGSEDTAQCGLNYNTYWPIFTTATATCEFEGDLLEDAILYVSINNDIVSCELNGHEVFESIVHEGCAPEDPRGGFSEDISSYVKDGTNELVCEVEDRGVMTHFDACVVGEYEEPSCELTVENFEGSYSDGGMEFFDSEAVEIKWHITEDCTPVDYFDIWYEEGGNCDPNTGSWFDVMVICWTVLVGCTISPWKIDFFSK